MSRRLLIVGNPGNRRVALWQTALARRQWPAAVVVAYRDLLLGRTQLTNHLSVDSLVRCESPGEDWEVFKLLLKHGLASAQREGYPALDEMAIDRLEYERGWLVRPRQWYLGFARLLQTLSCHIDECAAEGLNRGDDIAVCFDKPRCQRRLDRAGISIPAVFESARDYAELRAHYRDAGRIMVKLAHGSGGAGCLALHWSQGRVRALTTMVELTVHGEHRLYCSKRTNALCDEVAIAALVDRLCVEQVQVEAWLPKARWEGGNFDLRIVTIAGTPRHTMVRISASPFTNLTLGGRRGDSAAVAQRMGPESWNRLRDTCAKVAATFPNSFTLGLDVLVRPDWQRHAVLEVNAFGDLLVNHVDDGEDTYAATLAAWERKARKAATAS